MFDWKSTDYQSNVQEKGKYTAQTTVIALYLGESSENNNIFQSFDF